MAPPSTSAEAPVGGQRWAWWLELGRLLALASLPLLTVPLLAERRELPRVVLAELVAFGALALVGPGRLAGLDRRWARAALLAGGAWLLSCASALSPGRALFGPYEGHFGGLALLAYLALAAVPVAPGARPRWAGALALLGLFEALLALGQRARGGEATGSLGHIVFLAGFCMLAGTMALSLAVRAERAWGRVLFGLAFVACVAAIAVTGRRGPFLGLGVGAVAVGLLSPPAARRRLLASAGLAALLVLACGRVPLPDGSNLFSRFRLLAGSSLPGRWSTAQRRLELYRQGLQAFAEHPLLGQGFGTFRDRAAQVAQSEGEVEVSVHDLPLELLASTGAVGLLAFLALLAAWVGAARRTLQADPSPERVGAAGVALAQLTFLLFNFDQPAMAAWAWLVSGWLLDGLAPGGELVRPRWLSLAAGLGGLAALVPLVGDAWAASGVRADGAGRLDQAASDLRTAVRLTPYECFYTLRLAVLLRRAEPASSAQERIARLEQCLRLEPDAAFLHYHLGLAYADRARPGEAADRAEATVELRRATALAPSVALFHHAYAQALVSEHDLGSALAELDEALRLAPHSAGYLNDRGNVLALLGRTAEAASAYRAALAIDPGGARYQQNLEELARHAGPAQ